MLDEAQHVKNAATAQARAARSIPARHRVALTGTPVENRLNELWSILDFANPGMLGSAERVPRALRRADRARARRDGRRPAAHAYRAVRAAPGQDRPAVIADLPEKFEMTRALPTSPPSRRRCTRRSSTRCCAKIEDAEGIERKGAVLAALTKLKQVCNHPAHFLRDGSPCCAAAASGQARPARRDPRPALADGERALLFTQFARVRAMLSRRTWPSGSAREVPFLHGGTPKARRDAMVARFQAERRPADLACSRSRPAAPGST